MTPAGFPHSEIPGSKPVCGSPRLIAAYRVLRRLSAPRHPPCTLSSLTKLELSSSGESYRFSPDSVVKETRSLKIGACLRVASNPDATAHLNARPRRPDLVQPKNSMGHSQLARRAGGADRVRTDDLRLARAALSQLSYSPGRPVDPARPDLVGLGRFELPTSRLSGVRSNQLSYRPR